MTRRVWPMILLVLLAAPGCYQYGFRNQLRHMVLGTKPWDDVALARKGEDVRERREAMIRLVRYATALKGERWEKYNGRVQIAYSTSMVHEEEPMVRATAAALLRQVGTELEVPLLVRSLEGDPRLALRPEPSDHVRREVVKTLGVLGTSGEIPLLSRVLVNSRESADTRIEASYSLARIGGPEAVSALVEGLRDMDESVIFACWDGLHTLTGIDLPPAEAVWAPWWDEHRSEYAAEELKADKEI